MKPVYVLFTLRIAQTQDSFLINVTSTGVTDFSSLFQWQTSVDMDDFNLKMEFDYGATDFSGFDDLVLEDRTIIHLGYTSDEMLVETLSDVMAKYREEFIKHLGADKVSPVFTRYNPEACDLQTLYNDLPPYLDYFR